MSDEYLYLADLNDAPCVTARKEAIVRRIGNDLDAARVIVVGKEIEGWYVAGVPEGVLSKRFGISSPPDVNRLTKEQFNGLVPARFRTRVVFMLELLASFDREAARRRNSSFDYLLRKLEG